MKTAYTFSLLKDPDPADGTRSARSQAPIMNGPFDMILIKRKSWKNQVPLEKKISKSLYVHWVAQSRVKLFLWPNFKLPHSSSLNFSIVKLIYVFIPRIL